MIKISTLNFTIITAAAIALSSCTANLIPSTVKKNPNSTELESKGKEILQKAYVAHGSENLEKHETYQFTATDDWKGMMGTIGKIWEDKNSQLTLKYVPGTFDGQVHFNSGEDSGKIVGLQSWKYYEIDKCDKPNFDRKYNKKAVFGLAAFQYFTELVGRMNNAEIIRYGSEKVFNGNIYDLVYVTWKSEKKDKEVDQYILYINKETSMLDYAIYTLRDNYLSMPGTAMMYGSIGYSDYKNIDGFMVPFTQSLFTFKPEKNNNKYLHQLKLSTFTFDSFNKEELYPNKNIEAIGDSKSTKTK